MGWLWSSPTSGHDASTNTSTTGADWALSDEQQKRIFGRPRAEQTSSTSREAKADKELQELIESLSNPGSTSSKITSKGPSKSSSQPQHQEDEPSLDRINPDGSLNIHPEALYPRTMSCRQAFDQAFYCQSLGGKFKDIYRFGALQSCSEQWGAFWFCMRTKSYSPEEKERMIREHYREREERKKDQFGSSEDIWEIRTKAVERAFGRDPDAVGEGEDMAVRE